MFSFSMIHAPFTSPHVTDICVSHRTVVSTTWLISTYHWPMRRVLVVKIPDRSCWSGVGFGKRLARKVRDFCRILMFYFIRPYQSFSLQYLHSIEYICDFIFRYKFCFLDKKAQQNVGQIWHQRVSGTCVQLMWLFSLFFLLRCLKIVGNNRLSVFILFVCVDSDVLVDLFVVPAWRDPRSKWLP